MSRASHLCCTFAQFLLPVPALVLALAVIAASATGGRAAADAGSLTDPAAAAEAAAQKLDAATRALAQAEGAQNRVKALTGVIRAFEDGLQAMRTGLRRAALAEARLAAELRAREAETARLLGVLQGISATPAPVLLTHPSGPVGAARAGMTLGAVTPALEKRAVDLRARLQEMTVLRALQQSAADRLQQGLEDVQRARAALSRAIADRKGLPRRFTEDPVKTALLVASAETLTDFARGLDQIATDGAPGSLPEIADLKGELPWPVAGRVLHRAAEADAAGVVRPGVLLATRPRALVITPVPATVRYRGPLLDLGKVIILEPQAGLLLILAGLDTVYGKPGEVLPGGSPVGMMGGKLDNKGVLAEMSEPAADAAVDATTRRRSVQRSQTLYVEIRENNTPVDPETWFKTDKEG